MQINYQISVHANTLNEAVEKIGIKNGAIIAKSNVSNHGAGTELKKLISKFGLNPAPNCKCGSHIREMNQNGAEWCANNIDIIVGWLREEAQRAKLPFTEIGAKILIKRSIHNSNKNQNKDHDMTVKLIIEIDTDNVYDAFESTKPKEGKVTAATAEPSRPAPVPTKPISQPSK